jgi:hypothetical protein
LEHTFGQDQKYVLEISAEKMQEEKGKKILPPSFFFLQYKYHFMVYRKSKKKRKAKRIRNAYRFFSCGLRLQVKSLTVTGYATLLFMYGISCPRTPKYRIQS